MEGPFKMHQPNPQAYGQQPGFLYYNPDPTGENTRQFGHFTPQPHGQPRQQAQSAQSAQPTHALEQLESFSQFGAQVSYPVHTYAGHTLRPVAPQPMPQRPTILVQDQATPYLPPLDTDWELQFPPATPPLSSSSSSVCYSPPSTYDNLLTPVNGAEEHVVGKIEGVKEGCEDGVCSELLAAGHEWGRAGSPPMNPGKCIYLVISRSVQPRLSLR
jgi:C2H2 transcription facotor